MGLYNFVLGTQAQAPAIYIMLGLQPIGSFDAGRVRDAWVRKGGERVIVFTRNGGGGVSVTRQTGPNQSYGEWQDLGGLIVDYPVAAQTIDDRVTVFAIGLDGKLYRSRQTATTVTAGFGPWTLIG